MAAAPPSAAANSNAAHKQAQQHGQSRAGAPPQDGQGCDPRRAVRRWPSLAGRAAQAPDRGRAGAVGCRTGSGSSGVGAGGDHAAPPDTGGNTAISSPSRRDCSGGAGSPLTHTRARSRTAANPSPCRALAPSSTSPTVWPRTCSRPVPAAARAAANSSRTAFAGAPARPGGAAPWVGGATASRVHPLDSPAMNPTACGAPCPAGPGRPGTRVRRVPGLLLLRHAQSVWNADGRWQGWADPPLSAGGEQQTRRSARLLAGRGAVRRGGQLRPGAGPPDGRADRRGPDLAVPHWIETGLREYDVGDWSGCTLQQIEARWPGAPARFTSDVRFTPPGGESRTHFDDRVVAAGRRVGAAAATGDSDACWSWPTEGWCDHLARAAGQPDYRVGHLAGYRGSHTEAGLFPCIPCQPRRRIRRRRRRRTREKPAKEPCSRPAEVPGRDTVRSVKVEVVRSARRRKTVQARQVGGVLRVSIPASMTVADEQRWVAEMVRRMERRAASDAIDLTARAEALARAVRSAASGRRSAGWTTRSGVGAAALPPTAPSASPPAWWASRPGCSTT